MDSVSMGNGFEKIAVLLPTLNESEKIEGVLSGLKHKFQNIVIVDDGSTDTTPQKAKNAGAKVIKNPFNEGKGAALRKGLLEILKEDSLEAVIVMDADGQHGADDAAMLAEKWQREKNDLIVSERFLRSPDMPRARTLWNYIISKFFSMAVGKRITDSQCGLRLYSKDMIRKVLPESNGYVADSQMLAKAIFAGAKISKVPIRTIYNKPGVFRPAKDIARAFSIILFICGLAVKNKILRQSFFFALALSVFWLLIFRLIVSDIQTAKNRYAFSSLTDSDYTAAMNFLRNRSPDNAIVLSEWTQGHQVVALAERKTVATSKVYPSEAKELASRFRDIGKFFFSLSPEEAKEILDKYGASYVFLRKKNFDFFLCEYVNRCGMGEALIYRLLSGKELAGLKVVYETDQYKILKTNDGVYPAAHYAGFAGEYDYFKKEFKKWELRAGDATSAKILGGILPHHYPFTDKFFPEFFAGLRAANPSVVAVIGPDHNDNGNAPITFSERIWLTPFGELTPDLKILRGFDRDAIDEKTQRVEWSARTIIPYLKFALPDVKIIPVLMKNDAPFEEAAAFGTQLAKILPDDAVVILSADFAHKLTAEETSRKDEESRRAIETFDIDAVSELEMDSRPGLITLLSFLREKKATKIKFLGNETNETLHKKDPAHFPDYPYIVSYISYVFEK